ncbi:MAG: hypothetical protein HY819_05780 [Acidobacteria bacterium]|nr:hypothetical protein [Acidobacteriota bacterium]
MDLHLRILELGLDAKTWVDYIIQQTHQSMQNDGSAEMTDVASGLQRLSEKVEEMKKLLNEYMPQPTATGSRQYKNLALAQEDFRNDDGYPSQTLLGKYYAVGDEKTGYDIQFFTSDLYQRTLRDHPELQIVELIK